MINPVTMMINETKVGIASSSRCGSNTPVAVVNPGAFLALFAAVFGPSAAAAFGKLACKLFPAAALVVGALPDASTGVILPAEVTHNNTRPVLHVRCVVSNRKLLDQREDVEVVWELILGQLFFVILCCFWRECFSIE
jgi:hypothetical protein